MRVPLLFLVLLVATPTFAQPLATRLSRSVVMVEHKGGICTGFVVHSQKRNKDGESVDYVLTAAHCDGAELYADQMPAVIIHKDEKKDLMVLEVHDTDRPPLYVAKDNPAMGQLVMSYGYGYGLERPMLRVSHIADDDTYIPEDGIGGPLMATDAAFVGGQSGGPVVNEAGEVVMMVQRGSSVVGLGVGAEVIRSKVGRYLERKPQP